MSRLHSGTPAQCPWWKRCGSTHPATLLEFYKFLSFASYRQNTTTKTSARSRRRTSDLATPFASTEMPENLGIPEPCADSTLPGISEIHCGAVTCVCPVHPSCGAQVRERGRQGTCGGRRGRALIRQAAYKPLDEEISTEDMLRDLVFQRSVHQHRSRIAISIDGNPHCI